MSAREARRGERAGQGGEAVAGAGRVLHFGMHKTGSTSIQEALFRGRIADADYLHFGVPNSSRALVTAFGGNAASYHGNARRGVDGEELAAERERVRTALEQQLAEPRTRMLVLSAEDVVVLGAEELRELADAFWPDRDRRRAVGYVRDPAGYMVSAFQQRLKGGLEAFRPATLYPAYRRRFENLEQVLGRANVCYWRFQPRDFDRGCVVRDFCVRIGLRPPEATERRNESLSLPATQLLFAYRRLGPGAGAGEKDWRADRRLVARLQTLAGPRLSFAAPLTRRVTGAHQADLDWILERVPALLDADPVHEDRYAVAREADLLDLLPEALDWLLAEAAAGGVPATRPANPRQAARLMQALRGTAPAAASAASPRLRRRR